MRILSTRDPWVTFVERGEKTVELRTWWTHYRGPVLLVSGGKPWPGARRHGLPVGALGVTRCVVQLVDCVPVPASGPERDELLRQACLDPRIVTLEPGKPLWAWRLERATPVPHLPVKARLRLYGAPAELLASLAAAGVDFSCNSLKHPS